MNTQPWLPWFAAAVLGTGFLPAQAVQLRDGTFLVGEIQEPDGEGFTILRTDNGGLLKLRWEHLTQSSAKLIRTGLGLFDGEDAEITVRADVVTYLSPSGRNVEVVGRIVKRTETHFHVQRKADVAEIERRAVRGVSERQVTPSEIFTKDDYYQSLLAEVTPGEDADKHLLLGDKLMRVRDYEHARVHLEKSDALGGGRQGPIVKKQLEYLKLLEGAAAEQTLLDEIRTATNRGAFPAAQKHIDEFRERFKDSKLVGELERLEKNFKKARDTQLTRRVAGLWYKDIDLLASRKASDKVALAEAKRYAEREMGQEIRTQIAQALGVTTDEVEAYWGKRFEVRGAASPQHYYYSLGSWLLGEEAVLKDTKQGEQEKKDAESEKTDAEKELDKGLKRIQEALQRARQAAAQRGGDKTKEVSPEQWWMEEADPNARKTWLKAYYAEFSGDLKLTGAYLDECPTCAASGRVPDSVKENELVDCPTCHRTRFKRDIRAQ